MPFKKGNKYGGRRSGRHSNILRTPTSQDVFDEDMGDGDPNADEQVSNGTPNGELEEEAATPRQGEEDEAETPPTITTIPRRKRGRGGTRPSTRPEYDTPEPGEEGSESGTPLRRRRGRPVGSGSGRGRGGFRGRRKGAQPETPRVVDKDGTVLDVVDDEATVDDDADGNAKVDEKGNLQGGREYRVRTFTILGREDRLYMLSTEPARCCGFRDSYLFFNKHPKLYKVLIGEEEKKDLIDRDILPNSYKGRNIGVVTARSVFREFGARIIVGGRRITDDYKVAQAIANGEVEGELADPDDKIPDKREEYNRNRYVAWFGASEVYRNTGQSGVGAAGKQGQIGKRRTNVTLQNWQHMHAREASRFNSSLTGARRANLDGVYDTHTNLMFFPKIMQPTHARWEQLPPPQPVPPETESPRLTNGLVNGHHEPNATGEHDAMDIDEPARSQDRSDPSIFSDVPAVISRNFAVLDAVFTAPPLSNAGYPGPDGHVADPAAGPNGLSSVPSDVVDELPPECRKAFLEARATERGWKQQWATEARSALRGNLKVGFNGYPV